MTQSQYPQNADQPPQPSAQVPLNSPGYPAPYPAYPAPTPYPGYPAFAPNYPTLAPPKEYPVPPARHTPLIWLIALVALTVVAVALSLGGALALPAAPAAFGTTAYHNSLATADGDWTLQNGAGAQCSYANGGLDAVVASDTGIAPVCHLNGQSVGDFRLSVVVLPQAPLNYQLEPAIFVHGTLAILFNPGAGAFAVYSDNEPSPLYTGYTDQWHTSDQASNMVVIQSQRGVYTIALNGAQLYQGNFGGATVQAVGSVALGAWVPISLGTTSAEAAYADLALTTP